MTLTQLFTAIANAIRAKKGTQAPIVAENFPSEIASIVTEPNLQSKSVTITENGTTNVQADTGYDGLSGVEVVTNVSEPLQSYVVPNGMKFAYSTLTEMPNNLDFSNVSNFNQMFRSNENLTHISVDTANVTDLSLAFYDCKKITKVILTDTSKCTDFKYMFQTCNKLKEISNIDTSNGTDLMYMFAGCTELPDIQSTFNTTKCTNFEGMFRVCYLITKLPSMDTSKGKNFNNFAYGCTALTDVPIYDFSSMTNNFQMFYNCPNLSDESLNNIMYSLAHSGITTSGWKTLQRVGLTSAQATKCQSLSNYQAFLDAGWTTGY